MEFFAKNRNNHTESVEEHLLNTLRASEALLDSFISPNLAQCLGDTDFAKFCAGIHDIGKASPEFQNHIRGNFSNKPWHNVISYEILRRRLNLSVPQLDKSICEVIDAHHGKSSDTTMRNNLRKASYEQQCGFDSNVYQAEQTRLFDLIKAALNIDNNALVRELSLPRQVLLAGFVILCDWIASSGRVVGNSWKPVASELSTVFNDRFGEVAKPFIPRPLQSALADVLNAGAPNLLIIEAPMGEGKTEAALVAAETMASRFGCGGLYFALPTQASSNAMFSRIKDWTGRIGLDEPQTIDLLHGKKIVSGDYRDILDTHGDKSEGVYINEWLAGTKQLSLFPSFVIGTIDQLLITCLKQRHFMLRHLGMANKVVVIDEVHAYDAYMNVYLTRVMEWLGAYNVPVVLLSATLTVESKQKLINAYLNKQDITLTNIYPVITTADKSGAVIEHAIASTNQQMTVQLREAQEPIELLRAELVDGGVAGIICNTVKKAQLIYARLKEAGENAILLHSYFKLEDRGAVEEIIQERTGKNSRMNAPRDKLIVVGTQVLEQSLDLDFDVLITDLCPMDLLIQRIGRMHRHKRARPGKLTTPKCYLMENEHSGLLYTDYLLNKTRSLLKPRRELTLPNDIAALVNETYNGGAADGKDEYDRLILEKREKAKTYLLGSPFTTGKQSLSAMLNFEFSSRNEKLGLGAVRDTQDSVEVVLLYADEYLSQLDPTELQLRTLRLPVAFGTPWIIDKVIDALEAGVTKPRSDELGNLFLVLDGNNEAELCGYKLKYSKEVGLEYEKCE
ncbi:MAG: CRISPR-associated helicase Cas3' [Oscillospiraceae bacterium]|jgi:CRISPR-associated endonuclease/helicase Cas3|nr:CRISPR-associated helicase Cas3' [Oscillospiraceae bacterium]